MRVMVLIKATRGSEAGVMPSTELLEAMGRFNEALVVASPINGLASARTSRSALRRRPRHPPERCPRSPDHGNPKQPPRAEQRGIEHEQRLPDRFAADGHSLETIIPAGTPFWRRNAAPSRRDAARRGADVVYRGRLEDVAGGWNGYPDFLLPVDSPSAARHLPASRRRSSPEIGP